MAAQVAASMPDSMALFPHCTPVSPFPPPQPVPAIDTAMCSDEEDWTTVADAAERRRIQNRNAQRKYRRNLKRRVQALEQQQQQHAFGHASSSAAMPPMPPSLQHLFAPGPPGFPARDSHGPRRAAAQLPTPPAEAAALALQGSATCHHCGSLVALPAFERFAEDWGDELGGGQGAVASLLGSGSGLGGLNISFGEASSAGHGGEAEQGGAAAVARRGSRQAARQGRKRAGSPARQQQQDGAVAEQPSGAREPISGRSMLHIAAERGNDAMVRFLLEQGGDPNAKDDLGWTPLHLAVQQGHQQTVCRLLEAGGNLFARTER